MSIVISVDSTCDIPQELIDRLGIKTIYLNVTLGEKVYKDKLEVKPEDLYNYVNLTGKLPKTSAPNIIEYQTHFNNIINNGNQILHFSLSSEMSSAYQNAVLAADSNTNIRVIDTKNLSGAMGVLALKAADLIIEGYSLDDIAERCENLVDKIDSSFVVSTLDYLYKGGRCNALSALGANVLGLKPTIEVNRGIMSPRKKYRGPFDLAIIKYIQDKLINRYDIDYSRIIVAHTECTDKTIKNVVDEIHRCAPKAQVYDVLTGSTITTHCGPGTLGIMFLKK